MITHSAKGVLKLRSEPEEQQWAAAAICNSRPAYLSVPYLLEKLHCVHIVHASRVRAGPRFRSLGCFMQCGHDMTSLSCK